MWGAGRLWLGPAAGTQCWLELPASINPPICYWVGGQTHFAYPVVTITVRHYVTQLISCMLCSAAGCLRAAVPSRSGPHTWQHQELQRAHRRRRQGGRLARLPVRHSHWQASKYTLPPVDWRWVEEGDGYARHNKSNLPPQLAVAQGRGPVQWQATTCARPKPHRRSSA
jgi:hypothetical protein